MSATVDTAVAEPPVRRRRPARVLRAGGLSVRWERRAARAAVLLLVALVLLGFAALLTGPVAIAPGEVLASLLGQGRAGTDYAVLGLRLPRLATAVVVGVALGASGAIFQTISRNPLGSPDIIGFTTGAATGGVLAILIFRAGATGTSVAAVVGGLLTAVLVYALAYRRGVDGFRLILVGIGITAVIEAVNSYLIARARLQVALEAQVWQVGSLNGRTWTNALGVAVALAVLLPVAVGFGRRLSMLEMGPEAARARGVPVQGTTVVMVVVGVGLAAVATAAAGPISFVALAAPQLARRLSRTEGAGLVTAGLMGAVLLVASDVLAQRLIESRPLPVGLGTGLVGGLYLAWLLAREWRRGRG
ncbi:iron chelate uptake ABC transporter family permease subunit [Pseudonocardia ailaonensis]|uniref:Iron chelate uptake ABC transporter family permease subunit n=1 Tax=Pseudonocardia ailaonensis TaxID=367279 RepID=A0ABN2N6E6_9PSEU